MKSVEIFLERTPSVDNSKCEDLINELIAAYLRNGQIVTSEGPVAQSSDGYYIYASIPEDSSLIEKKANPRVSKALAALLPNGLRAPRIRLIGTNLHGLPTCSCQKPPFLILYSNFLEIGSPLRCGECFMQIPLYRIPPTAYTGDYEDILKWQGDYEACDRFHIGSGVGERFGYKQMSQIDSELSKEGIELCKHISELSRIQTYYYLYRYYGRSDRADRKMKCPSCKGEWLLSNQLHKMFDFKCDNCRLLSNVAWDIRSTRDAKKKGDFSKASAGVGHQKP